MVVFSNNPRIEVEIWPVRIMEWSRRCGEMSPLAMKVYEEFVLARSTLAMAFPNNVVACDVD
jgi:hypothetical protein